MPSLPGPPWPVARGPQPKEPRSHPYIKSAADTGRCLGRECQTNLCNASPISRSFFFRTANVHVCTTNTNIARAPLGTAEANVSTFGRGKQDSVVGTQYSIASCFVGSGEVENETFASNPLEDGRPHSHRDRFTLLYPSNTPEVCGRLIGRLCSSFALLGAVSPDCSISCGRLWPLQTVAEAFRNFLQAQNRRRAFYQVILHVFMQALTILSSPVPAPIAAHNSILMWFITPSFWENRPKYH